MPSDYAKLACFLFIGVFISVIPIIINRLIALRPFDPNKSLPYECGFDPFSDARFPFDIRFYLVAILFIIFDLEMAFLFPWAMIVKKELTTTGFIAMLIFLAILVAGFIYEWKKGALEWE